MSTLRDEIADVLENYAHDADESTDLTWLQVRSAEAILALIRERLLNGDIERSLAHLVAHGIDAHESPELIARVVIVGALDAVTNIANGEEA